MFNNVILDVATGVVFIFLLYSLLATSIQEAIATGLALRARTLKDGIINGMLCNTPDISRIESLGLGIWSFIKSFLHLFHKPPVAVKRLGHYFYDHPLIKNYGASRIFSAPSYLPGGNFSTVLIDVLRDDFDRKLDAIAATKVPDPAGQTMDQVREGLHNSADGVKIRELLNYYATFYLKGDKVPGGVDLVIEKDTWQLLQMHLRNSFYNLDDFVKKIETWYDDSMDRISGWYKRRVQFLLFAIGLLIAVIFNVDIIRIAGKLSSDKDARDQLVQLAIKEADSYKDDPRVKRSSAKDTSKDSISAGDARTLYDQHIKAAKKVIDSSIVKPNQILALGWGDYGRGEDSIKHFKKVFLPDSAMIIMAYSDAARNASLKQAKLTASVAIAKPGAGVKSVPKSKKADTAGIKINGITMKDSLRKAKACAQLNAHQLAEHAYTGVYGVLKTMGYVICKSWDAGKIAGFLLTAMAICLGAPFWFDLLNKLVNIRAAGKREENNNSSGAAAGVPPGPDPVTVNIGSQQAGEEAVG
jgi:hypothetical protein